MTNEKLLLIAQNSVAFGTAIGVYRENGYSNNDIHSLLDVCLTKMEEIDNEST